MILKSSYESFERIRSESNDFGDDVSIGRKLLEIEVQFKIRKAIKIV